MHDAEQLIHIYTTVSNALHRRPRESLLDAARRYRLRRLNGPARAVAARVLGMGDKRGPDAWRELAAAAELARAQCV